jgi:hypothetical protein
VKLVQLDGREDPVLEQVDADSLISFGDRSRDGLNADPVATAIVFTLEHARIRAPGVKGHVGAAGREIGVSLLRARSDDGGRHRHR